MAGLLRSLYLSYFSKPAGLRPLYRLLCKRRRREPIRKITELGVGRAERTVRLLELCAGDDAALYTGIDLFEARRETDGPGLSLKAAHKKLAATGVKTKLIPGDPHSALARSANALADQDLIVISADLDREALAKAWFYVPRMLHDSTLVFEEAIVEGAPVLQPVSHDEVARRAAAAKGKRAA
jgi:hypothetical protein